MSRSLAIPYRTRQFINLPAISLALLALTMWILLAQSGLLSERVFPSARDVFLSLAQLIGTPTLWTAMWGTMSTWLLALSVAATLAILLGLVIGSIPLVHSLLAGLIEFFRPIPSIAILPLALLVLGPTTSTKLLLTIYTAFWLILVQAIYGVRSTDPVLKDVAASLSIGRTATLFRIVLPSALPYMLIGLRLGASVGLILCITVELIVGVPGLGAEIALAQSAGALGRMYSLIGITALLGWGLNTVFYRFQVRSLHWYFRINREK